ncbi:MAG TPA: YXWGXW repeat-containing protein [Polyangiaceae bacterium]|nr:YXWGXW repeat-containing protein [Polyangiaceae bacterium]
MRATSLLLLCTALVGAGACATQREQRLSSAEVRERPTDEPCEPKGKPPKPGAVWACGYWHWDSVHYVWVDGRWQSPR